MGYNNNKYLYHGKEYNAEQMSSLIKQSNTSDRKTLQIACNIQNMMYAKDRMENETDLYKKQLMKEMIDKEQYDFSLIFGENPN